MDSPVSDLCAAVFGNDLILEQILQWVNAESLVDLRGVNLRWDREIRKLLDKNGGWTMEHLLWANCSSWTTAYYERALPICNCQPSSRCINGCQIKEEKRTKLEMKRLQEEMIKEELKYKEQRERERQIILEKQQREIDELRELIYDVKNGEYGFLYDEDELEDELNGMVKRHEDFVSNVI